MTIIRELIFVYLNLKFVYLLYNKKINLLFNLSMIKKIEIIL